MKNQSAVVIVIIILPMTMIAICSSLLLLSSSSFAFSKNIVEASSTTSINNNYNSSLLLRGIISSLILDIPVSNSSSNNNDNITSLAFNITNIQKFILAGDWNMKFDNNMTSTHGNSELHVASFGANFMAIAEDGKGAHTHQIYNFRPVAGDHFNLLSHSGNASMLGIADIGINGHRVWQNVRTNITLSEGKILKILFDDKALDYHFGKGQAIYGLLTKSDIG